MDRSQPDAASAKSAIPAAEMLKGPRDLEPNDTHFLKLYILDADSSGDAPQLSQPGKIFRRLLLWLVSATMTILRKVTPGRTQDNSSTNLSLHTHYVQIGLPSHGDMSPRLPSRPAKSMDSIAESTITLLVQELHRTDADLDGGTLAMSLIHLGIVACQIPYMSLVIAAKGGINGSRSP
uniref:Uncharacterized protein n=1 Tax=Moniliophthora roreri TaxID=221103 RepID=A0A0W0G2E9_MONRR